MTDLPLYQIVDWDDNFENFKSRTIDKCQYLNLPNKQGGSGWSNVMGEADGMAIYGVWVSIATMCSRQRRHEVTGGKVLREGYVTDNGKKDGRRLSARELSNMFRRPIEEIHRCFQVVTSPVVGWLRLAAGEHEYAQRMPEGYSTSYPPAILEKEPEASSAHPPPISPPDDDRLIDRKSTLSAEPGDGKNEHGQPITEGCPEDASAPDAIQHAEAKRLFGGLALTVFKKTIRETQWPSDLEHHLDAALPMPRESWALIEWFYRVAEDHPIFNVTMRRQSFESLIENLTREPQKIRSARKTIGLNCLTDTGNRIAESDEWTPSRKKAATELYGARELPALFSQMPASARTEIDRKAGEVAA